MDAQPIRIMTESEAREYYKTVLKAKLFGRTYPRLQHHRQPITPPRTADEATAKAFYDSVLALRRKKREASQLEPTQRNDLMARTSPVGRLSYRTDAASAKFSVKAAWKRLAKWSVTHLPGKGGMGDPPATAEQISAFEKAIGVQLPADVRQSYRLYNGQCPGPGIIYGLAVEPLRDCLNNWSHWVKGWGKNEKDGSARDFNESCRSFPDGFVSPVYFNRKWVPLTYDGSGNHIAVDLDPGPKGIRGQVIKFGPDDHDHTVLALSWAQFLTDIADELEAGNVYVGEEEPDIPDIGVADPHSTHFHSVGYQWSRAKLGLRRLSTANQSLWRKAGYK